MKTEQLRYLIDLEETKSITKTAERFFMSQQAISEAIRKLEAEFNTTLLVRKKYGVDFTEAGKEFCIEAHKQLFAYERLQRRLNPEYFGDKLIQGKLSIEIHPRIFRHSFSDFLSLFLEKYPKINVLITAKNNSEIADDLLHFKTDIGIFWLSTFKNDLQYLHMKEICTTIVNEENLYLCSLSKPSNKDRNLEIKGLLKNNLVRWTGRCHIEGFHTLPKTKAIMPFCRRYLYSRKPVKHGLAAMTMTKYEYSHVFNLPKDIKIKKLPDELKAIMVLANAAKNTDNPLINIFNQEVPAILPHWKK